VPTKPTSTPEAEKQPKDMTDAEWLEKRISLQDKNQMTFLYSLDVTTEEAKEKLQMLRDADQKKWDEVQKTRKRNAGKK
jgi:hypothetical protein